MREIEEKIIEVISLFKYLNHIEDFGAYKKILIKYNEVLKNIKHTGLSSINKADFEPLLNVTRLYYEAVPSDNILARYISDRMQELYELLKQRSLID